MSEIQKKRLFDMEIDEISLVDRGANQHAAIVISKALGPEEEFMPEVELYDAEGDLIEELEHGDVVYDNDGNEYVYVDDVSEYEDEDMGKSEGYESVAKYNFGGAASRLKAGFAHGRNVRAAKGGLREGGSMTHGEEAGLKNAVGFATNPESGRVGRAGLHFGAHAGKYGAGGAGLLATGTAGGVYGKKRGVEKSLGDVVLEELSKAANEDERSEVIAKAMEEVEIAKAQADEAWQRVAQQEDAQLESAFISKAAEFNLPIDPVELGLILKAASTVLSGEQLDTLEQLFNGVGEALYEEVGYIGDTDNNSVLDVVNGYVDELIGKADATPEMLQTAIFDSNPGAYDAYLAENR